MKVEVKNGHLIITIPMQEPAPSASGKTLVVATTRGNRVTEVEIEGKPLIIGLTAYVNK